MSLSSLIVQRDAATMRQVEEALARQVIYGGDLVTNLLEIARVDEAVLTALLAESMQIAAAPSGELPVAPEFVRTLIPAEFAVQSLAVPLDVEQQTMVIAVAEPLAPDVRNRLSAALGMEVEQLAAPAVRVWQALASAYGIQLDRRIQRLLTRLAGGPTSLPPSIAPSPMTARAPSPMAGPVAVASRAPESSRPSGPSTVGAIAQPLRIAAVRLKPQRHPTLKTFPQRRISSFPAAAAASAASISIEPSPVLAPSLAPSSDHHATVLQRNVSPSMRPSRRRRGPLTYEMVRREAEEAVDRDALLDLYFDYSRQFFDYAALFLVQGDIAEGRDAFGGGAARERVLGIGVPLDLPSVLSTAREKRVPMVARGGAEGLDAVLLSDLQRPAGIEMAAIPLVVRTRAVALMVGDCNESGVDRDAIQQVLACARLIGKGFERIIVRRKLEGFVAGNRGPGEGRVGPRSVESRPPPSQPPLAAAVATPSSSPPTSFDGRPSPPTSFQALAFSPPAFQPPSSSPPSGLQPVAAEADRAQTSVDSTATPASKVGATTLRGPFLPVANPPPRANLAAVRAVSVPALPREDDDSSSDGIEAPPDARSPGIVSPDGRSRGQVAKRSTDPYPRRAADSGDDAATQTPDAPAAHLEEVATERSPVVVPRRASAETVDPFSASFDSQAARGWRTSDAPDISAAGPEISIGSDRVPAPDANDSNGESLAHSGVVVPPHHPAAPHAAQDSSLPTVIIDLEGDLGTVVDRIIRGEADETAEAELLHHGVLAMPAVMQRFPGPVTFERARIATMTHPPRASECGPVLRLVARERKVALPFVLDRLTSTDLETRGWATYLLAELPYPDAIPHLIDRLRDDDPSIRVAAARALSSIARSSPDNVAEALKKLARSNDARSRIAAARAMGEVRDGWVVPELIAGLRDAADDVAAAAHGGLVVVTRHDLGRDPRPWLKWWDQNGRRHRIEWLIDALTHDVSEVRRAAGEELRVLSRQYFGYASELPSRDRERAQQRYRDWWITEGRARLRQS